MSQKFGYIVDLADYKFDETTSTTWIHGAPLGEYTHPLYGKMNFTAEKCKAFADGVKSNVRGQELDIDYDHKEKINDAAGWVKNAEAREDGLWLQVDWTPTALTKLKEKAYRYFSPEFQDEWTHPATGVKHTNVLFGGGLTNRPYLKGIMPINLSEFTDNTKIPEGSKSMTPEQKTALATKYGLGENATDEEILKAAQDAELKDKDPVDNSKDDAETAATAQLAEMQKQIDEVKKLSESNPAMKAVVALMETQQIQLKALAESNAKNEAALHLSEMQKVAIKLDEKAKEKGYALPKPVMEGATKFLSENSKSAKFAEDFYQFAEQLMDAKLVQLGEVRPGSKTSEGSGDAVKKFSDAVAKEQKDNDKMTYIDAVEKVANEQPQLYSEYRTETSGGAS